MLQPGKFSTVVLVNGKTLKFFRLSFKCVDKIITLAETEYNVSVFRQALSSFTLHTGSGLL